MRTMETFCDDILWLKDGRIEAFGPPKDIIRRYVDESIAETRRRMASGHPDTRASSGRELRMHENRFGSLELEITGVRILNDRREMVDEIEPGASVVIEIEYDSPRPISCPHFGVTISRPDEFVCFEVTTAADGHVLPDLVGHGRVGLALDRLDLSAGDYFVNVSAYEREWSYTYDSHWHVYPLRVQASTSSKGLLWMPHRWRFEFNGQRYEK
jgi:lipopolysaccharide transport system ATP-binding protein